MATYNAVAGTMTTDLLSAYGTLKPQNSSVLWWKYGYFCPINAIKSIGLTRQVAGPAAQHFEGGHPVPNWIVGSVVTAPAVAGDPIVLGVSAQNVSAQNTVYPSQGERFRLVNGQEAYITSVTLVGGTWRVTAIPMDSTVTLSAAAGQSMWMIDQLSAEGSQSPNNSKVIPKQLLSYPLQIVRNNTQLTGSGELTELWTTTDQFGNKISAYYEQTLNLEWNQTTKISNSVFWGQPNANTSNITGNAMYGMDYTISSGGYTHLYPNNNFTLTDLATLARVSQKRSAGNEFFGIAGPDFMFATQNGLQGVFAQNPIVFQSGSVSSSSSYAKNFVSNMDELKDEMGIVVNIRHVGYGGVNFDWVGVQQFGQEQTGGAAGRNESSFCFFIPMSKSANLKGDFTSRFSLTSRSYEGKNREMLMWSYGGSAAQNKNGYDGQIIEALSEIGTEYQDIEKFIICKPF